MIIVKCPVCGDFGKMIKRKSLIYVRHKDKRDCRISIYSDEGKQLLEKSMKNKKKYFIRVSDETHQKLVEIKSKYDFRSLEHIIVILTELYENGVFDELWKMREGNESVADVIRRLLVDYQMQFHS